MVMLKIKKKTLISRHRNHQGYIIANQTPPQSFLRNFGHFRGFGLILVIQEDSVYFFCFEVLGVFWSF